MSDVLFDLGVSNTLISGFLAEEPGIVTKAEGHRVVGVYDDDQCQLFDATPRTRKILWPSLRLRSRTKTVTTPQQSIPIKDELPVDSHRKTLSKADPLQVVAANQQNIVEQLCATYGVKNVGQMYTKLKQAKNDTHAQVVRETLQMIYRTPQSADYAQTAAVFAEKIKTFTRIKNKAVAEGNAQYANTANEVLAMLTSTHRALRHAHTIQKAQQHENPKT